MKHALSQVDATTIQTAAGPRGTITLILRERIPSKKNMLRPRAGKGRAHMYDADTKARLDSLSMQARAQWAPRRPLESPDVVVRLFVNNPAKDRDGMLTSVLDSLKTAGVIEDDSIRWLNGRITLHPAQIVPKKEERAEITLVFDEGKGSV